MNIETSICHGLDTFVYVNGHRIRLGREWTEQVTADKLSNRYARAFREIGAKPMIMNPIADSVFGIAERADGNVDAYTVFRSITGTRDVCYICTVTPTGERVYR